MRRSDFFDLAERIVFGGEVREGLAKRILAAHYRSRRRRHWRWQAKGEPHFTDHAINFYNLFDGKVDQSVYGLTRAMAAAEAVFDGAAVLDIGCGDGSFTKRFLAPKASHVDGIDIEPSAIAWASRLNGAPNVAYHLADAVRDPLPREQYDVAVFDGAIGHIGNADSDVLLGRIAKAIGDHGVFVGSESLGHEGSDHLQFFETLDALRAFLSPHFAHVRVKEISYKINRGALLRTEAFWRCSQDPARLAALDWS